ncbi:MAG: cyclase [Halioglobus sp.]
MNKLISRALATIFLVFSSTTVSLAAEAAPEVTTTALRGPLYLLHGMGGNVVASVGIDGIMLVDDDYATYAEAYQKAISTLSQSDLAPSFILNTHWHGDHTGSNDHWGMRGTIIFAHTNVRGRMSSRQENKMTGKVTEPSPMAALPVVTYGDSIAFHFNGGDVEVQHYPGGHTDGDSVVYYAQENVVHMGDLFFRDRFPYVDISAGGNLLDYTANVEKVLQRVSDNTLIVPGHGELANKQDLQRFHQMLLETTAAVKASLAEGMGVEAIIEKGLGAKWSSWGTGFINEASWIKLIAASPVTVVAAAY